MQIEVSSGKYIAHVASKQQEVAASQDVKNAAPPHEQLMSQLSELDKLGQEGAAPVDDAEVTFCWLTASVSLYTYWKPLQRDLSCTWKWCVCALYAAVCLCQCRHMKPETHIMVVLQVRKIDRKLKACHNPLLDPDSDLFKQLAAARAARTWSEREEGSLQHPHCCCIAIPKSCAGVFMLKLTPNQ